MSKGSVFVSIDVSKAQLDVAMRPEERFSVSTASMGSHSSSDERTAGFAPNEQPG